MKKYLLLFMSILYYAHVNAQDYSTKENNIRNLIQEIMGNPVDGISEDLFESLYQNYLNPLDLNTVSRPELASLYILSEKQLNSFFNYRDKAGKFLSIYELQAIPDFDLATIYKFIPFVTVKADGLSIKDFQDSWQKANQYLLLRYTQYVETKKGFTEPDSRSKVRYEGSPMKLYARYKISLPKNFSAGFTAEKDEGESQLTDFTSFHFQIQNKGHWKNINLGDYQLQFGQGLIAAAGFYLGKGSETVLTTRRNHLGVRPYTSVMESNFFRGGAATYQFKAFEMTGFYSRVNRDANLALDKNTNANYVTSLQTAGLHRTASEIADKRSLMEENFGGDITFNNKTNTFQAGITLLKTNFSLPLIKADKVYNQYEFSGQDNLLTGLHWSYNYQNYNFFGEAARSTSGGIGAVTGVLASLSNRTDISVLLRNYDKDFHSFYGNGFSENSRNINERGIYSGIKHSFNKKWSASAYFDYFYFPWYRYLVDKQPTTGFDYLGRITFQPSKKLQAYLQFRQENKEENTKITETYLDKGKEKTREITVVRERSKRALLANINYRASKIWEFQTRASFSTFQFEGQSLTKGFAIAQDVNADLGRLSLSGRIAYFNTDDYDNRQYFYEQDVLYAFSFPAYYQHGFRHYLLAKYKVSRNVDAWVRWARTDLLGDDATFGSGLEEILASHRSEVKVQLRLHF
ncbi:MULTISPECIES: helix-hairpin-helix domain-containing protein [unclassified Arcicella]|uniref:ComEA family DNA-binding protein n=1 Tax=unclassified Arcicella TaxID=2644986 RepID=UPI002856A419|nr:MULTISPECIES: helix-hairpin-helix domain-containing protein [unclassified Arcicella]MDR6560482.1 hypothetical protein [Arcicella sp. BE51]MDR6809912.1 hypothetical protein [Arcicella sp. BE140]MDR6821261.1 hypothetical protein [Arcicella sp. BE139]